MIDIKTLVVLAIISLLASFVKIDLIMIIMQKRKILKNKRFWVSTILFGLYLFISYLITDNVVRVILEFLILVFLCLFILEFRKKYFMSIIVISFIIWVLLLLIDLFFSIVWVYLLNLDMDMANSNAYIKFFITLCSWIALIMILLIPKLRKFLIRIICNMCESYHNYYVIFVIVLSVIMFSISVYICLFNYNVVFTLIMLFSMIFIYTAIVIITIKEFAQRNKIQVEYDMLSENLSEYENLLDMQRVSNHENKNQLLVIKGMVDKKENNISEYIGSIIDTQYADNDLLIMKTNRIPSGGLRGLVYYKMLTMKDKKIEVELEVDRGLRSVDFSNIPVKTNQELCKIVGVFLDNAIQAVEKLKLRKIDIGLNYVDDEVIIKISNNYDGSIDIDKLSDKGYTTKGKGHGYGLSLVKQIVDGNNRFTHDTEVNGKLFSQVIKLNLK